MSLLLGMALTCGGSSGTAAQTTEVETMTTSELARRVSLDGSGPWYELLGAAPAEEVAASVAAEAFGDRPPVLLSAGDSDLSRTPESVRHLVEDPALREESGSRHLSFWYAWPPGFGPNRLSVTAGASSATVEQASLDDLLGDERRSELMLGHLVGESRRSRQAAARHFTEHPDPRAVAGCLAALEDGWADLRAAAARCLAANVSPDAIAPLGATLLAEQDAGVAWDLAKALVAHGEAAREPLERAAAGAPDPARQAAAWGVAQL